MNRFTIQLTLRRGTFTLNVDVTLPGRGVTGLFGPSGCGKTSLLRGLSGLERAQGHIGINGARWLDSAAGIDLPAHRRRVGYVFQDAALFTHLDVRGNLDYGRSRTPVARRRIVLEQVIDWLGLAALLTRRVPQLSGGEAQRVAMGRALLTSPDLLLLDEPLAALDQDARQAILPYLERLHRELAVPVIYVSHAQDEITRLADHLLLLDAGKVRASGPLAELLTRPDLPLSRAAAAAAILEGHVVAVEESFGLTWVDTSAGRIALAVGGLAIGTALRLRIAARDVSLALRAPADTSILNCLPARVTAIVGHDPAQIMVHLQAGGAPLLARITRKSREQLGIGVGAQVHALIKSVALVD
ncbi:MAG: molybdenum ABC transporter ATP-binding protein [Gammaproteobacteria bacterium]|nr:molybdenum ABC transporter ATP-binding protein [Gammaproteobacteria bacterium]